VPEREGLGIERVCGITGGVGGQDESKVAEQKIQSVILSCIVEIEKWSIVKSLSVYVAKYIPYINVWTLF